MMLEQMNSGHKLKELDNMLDQSSPLIIKYHKHELEIIKLKKEQSLREQRPKISDFEINEVVGIGNFGKVYKAYNKKYERICALKVLKKESVAAMKQVDHIISEREVL